MWSFVLKGTKDNCYVIQHLLRHKLEIYCLCFTGTLWNMLIAGCKQQRVWLRVIKSMSVDQIGHFEVWFRRKLWAEREVRASFREPRVSCCPLSEDRHTNSLRAVLVYKNCALLSAATSECNECVFWRSVLQPRSLVVQGWWFWFYPVKSPQVFKFITVVEINCILFRNEMVLRQVVFRWMIYAVV